MAEIIGTVLWLFDGPARYFDLFHESGLNAGFIETPVAPVARTLPFAAGGREDKVILIGHAEIFGIITHHVECVSADLNKAATGSGLGHGYLFAATLNGPIDF